MKSLKDRKTANLKRLLSGLATATALVLVLGSTPFVVSGASAQEAQEGQERLTVSPPRVELNGEPGQVIEEVVSIDNGATVPRQIDVTVQSFAASGEAGQAALLEEEGPYSLAAWTEVSPTSVVIPPGGRQEFNIKVTVPENPPPGGRFGAVVFGPTSIESDANVKVLSRISTLVLLRVPGEADETASIESVTTSELTCTESEGGAVPEDDAEVCQPKELDEEGVPKGKKFFTSGPVGVNVRFNNQGNVLMKPKVRADIYNLFGSKIDSVEVDPENVLPESIRRFDLKWDREQLLGMYKAKVNVTYGEPGNEQVIESETTVWAAPVGVIAGIVGFLAAFFFLVWLPRKRLKKAFAALRAG